MLGKSGGGVSTILEESRVQGIHYTRGKLPKITQACRNKRFNDSGDSGAGRDTPQGPPRRGKAAEGPLRGRKGETSGLAGLD